MLSEERLAAWKNDALACAGLDPPGTKCEQADWCQRCALLAHIDALAAQVERQGRVVEAARKRLLVWTRDSYDELIEALAALSEPSREVKGE